MWRPTAITITLLAASSEAFAPSSSYGSASSKTASLMSADVESVMTETETTVNGEPVNGAAIETVTLKEFPTGETTATASKKTSRKPQMSTAIPFLEQPPVLTGELAGDFGFDPLRLAKNKESLWAYREAEIKHARLAMLAAAGWPVSELLDRSIANYFGVESALDDADRVPLIFNSAISPEFWGFCLGLTAAIDMYGVKRARSAIPGYIPGDLGWDPLSFYPLEEEGKKRMQLAEIKHGRTAMVAVTGFASQEAISNMGVVDETPIFFFPITETAEKVLQDVVEQI